MEAAKPHIEKAKEMAWRPKDGLFDMTKLYETVCEPAMGPTGFEARVTPAGGDETFENRKIPPRSAWYQEPAKVFDNLYWLGGWGSASRVPTKGGFSPAGNSTWAVKTSEGFILIDSGYDFSAPTLITEGLKKMGEDPSQIKYVILSHAHNDRYYGAKYLQDTYHAHIIMSAADWDVIANPKNTDFEQLKPKRDMVATDGMKVTLGDTTLTVYLTPGHTPGAYHHHFRSRTATNGMLGAVWGGINQA